MIADQPPPPHIYVHPGYGVTVRMGTAPVEYHHKGCSATKVVSWPDGHKATPVVIVAFSCSKTAPPFRFERPDDPTSFLVV